MGIGGDLYVRRDGRVFHLVPDLNAVTPDGRQGWTEVYTGQRVKIVNPALALGHLRAGY